MTKPISQAEAHRLKRQVAALTETIKQMIAKYDNGTGLRLYAVRNPQ